MTALNGSKHHAVERSISSLHECVIAYNWFHEETNTLESDDSIKNIWPVVASSKMVLERCIKVGILVCICMVVFGNHWIRDSVGALEWQLEKDIPISPSQYSLFNAFYFFPNILSPLCVGVILQKLNRPSVFLVFACMVGSIGNVLFTVGVQNRSFHFMVVGRALSGSCYEIIDTIPAMVLRPYFLTNWNVTMGFLNSFVRLGSVFNFFVTPYCYQHQGIVFAFWVSSAVGLSIVLFSSVSGLVLLFCAPASYSNLIRESSEKDQGIELQEKSNKTNVRTDATDEIHTTGELFSLCTMYRFAIDLFPFHKMNVIFYYYITIGSLIYGTMVPFWFVGSKFLQHQYQLSISYSDFLMLLPEGIMVFLSPLIGSALDYFRFSLRVKFFLISICCLMLPFSYTMLLIGYDQEGNIIINPLGSMILLGTGYAFTNCLFWSCLIQAIPEEYFSFGCGLVASFMNIFPSIIPLVVSELTWPTDDGVRSLISLSVVGLITAIFSLHAANIQSHNQQDNIETTPYNFDVEHFDKNFAPLDTNSKYKHLSQQDPEE